jgi:hypothetical protein
MSKEWKDGLPSAGDECEMNTHGAVWRESRCVGHDVVDGVDCAVVVNNGGYCAISSKGLRSVQTQADKEREEAIHMLKANTRLPYAEADGWDFISDDHLGALYDAGYRLPVEQGEVIDAQAFIDEWMADKCFDYTGWIDSNYIITRKPK